MLSDNDSIHYPPAHPGLAVRRSRVCVELGLSSDFASLKPLDYLTWHDMTCHYII